MIFFLLLNIKKTFWKITGIQCCFEHRLIYVVFCRRKKTYSFGNMRVSKWRENVLFFFVCPFKLCNLRLFKLLNSCCSVSVSSNRLWCSCFCTSLSNLGESGARGWKEWNEVFKNPSTSLFLPDSFQERVENLTRTSDKRHKHLTWKPVHRNHQLKKMACTSCYGWSQNFFF